MMALTREGKATGLRNEGPDDRCGRQRTGGMVGGGACGVAG